MQFVLRLSAPVLLQRTCTPQRAGIHHDNVDRVPRAGQALPPPTPRGACVAAKHGLVFGPGDHLLRTDSLDTGQAPNFAAPLQLLWVRPKIFWNCLKPLYLKCRHEPRERGGGNWNLREDFLCLWRQAEDVFFKCRQHKAMALTATCLPEQYFLSDSVFAFPGKCYFLCY